MPELLPCGGHLCFQKSAQTSSCTVHCTAGCKACKRLAKHIFSFPMLLHLCKEDRSPGDTPLVTHTPPYPGTHVIFDCTALHGSLESKLYHALLGDGTLCKLGPAYQISDSIDMVSSPGIPAETMTPGKAKSFPVVGHTLGTPMQSFLTLSCWAKGLPVLPCVGVEGPIMLPVLGSCLQRKQTASMAPCITSLAVPGDGCPLAPLDFKKST